jgi:hypothetical protein
LEEKMATNEIRDALKTAADQIAKYVQDAAEMSVETTYIEMGSPNFDTAKLAARTIVKLDGDSQTVLPMRKDENGVLVVDAVVFDLHQQNVQAAIDYRAEMMTAMLSVLRGE